jgi:hypothetical protein
MITQLNPPDPYRDETLPLHTAYYLVLGIDALVRVITALETLRVTDYEIKPDTKAFGLWRVYVPFEAIYPTSNQLTPIRIGEESE